MVPMVRMGPRESQGWLLGMRVPQLVLVLMVGWTAMQTINWSGALPALAGRVAASGLPGSGAAVPVAVILRLVEMGVLLAVAFLPVRGRYLDQYVPVALNFAVQKVTGHNVFRGGVFRMSDSDVEARGVALPGELAHLEFLAFQVGDGGEGSEVCVVKDPRSRTYTAVLVGNGSDFVLADSAQRSARIAAFGAMQSRLSTAGNLLSRIQVVERTEPDSGEHMQRDYRRRGLRDGSFQAQAYEQLLAVAPDTQQAHEVFVAVQLDARKAAGDIRRAGGADQGACAVLFREMDAVATDLESAGVAVEGWCPPRLLGFIIRTAYDPASRAMIERRGGADNDLGGGDEGLPSGVDLRAAGPMHAENHWGYYATDSGYHRCWWIAQWPRQEVEAGFLMPLLLSSTCRRVVSWVMEPVPVDKARRRISNKVGNAESEAKLRARIGRRTTKQQQVEDADVARREEELAAGFGMARMIGFIATTAQDLDGLEEQSAEIERLAHQSSIEVTRLWGEHDQAFAATALPLGRGLR